MTTSAEHPNDHLLQAYVQGRLPLADAAALDRHLESCDECGHKLAEVGTDTYSDLLRLPVTEAHIGVIEPLSAELPSEMRNHGRYEIQELLGRGGMGVVYRAVHRMMHRSVALKLIRPEFLASPEAVERFRREVRAAAQLAHPNIVAAYDAEEVGGVHFLVMEYVNGKTLDAIVRKRGPLSVSIACHLARQVALGLDHAHSRDLVHRDIKPHNLILADKCKVKILDFGLALCQRPEGGGEPTTKEGQALGTLLYSAPEQRQSAGTVDARADQYSLGATLAFLLTGESPLPQTNWPETIPEGVRAILTRLMAKSPDDRYPSAKAVAEALTPWCSTRLPTLETSPSRSRKFAFAIATGVVLFAVGVGIWSQMRSRSVEPVVPSKQSETVDREWSSLLDFDSARHAVAGEWRMVNGELHVSAALGARIAIPGTVPAEYDLGIDFTRETGSQSVGAIVVQNGHRAVFELDAWNQHLGGFQNIAGRTLKDNATRRDDIRLFNKRRYTMLVEVRRDSIRGLLDGREVAVHRTNGLDLSIDSENWAMPLGTTLGLVAWDSATTFHRVAIAPR